MIRNVSNKWASAFLRTKGKSSNGDSSTDMCKDNSLQQYTDKDDACTVWDLEPMKKGPQGIPKDTSTMYFYFVQLMPTCLWFLMMKNSMKSRLLLHWNNKEQLRQCLIQWSTNGFLNNSRYHNNPLMDAAVRCLYFLYERDCKRSFCPPSLWLAPTVKCRPPIAAAARAHEAVSTCLKSGDSSVPSTMGYLVTTTPHVFPFEERV